MDVSRFITTNGGVGVGMQSRRKREAREGPEYTTGELLARLVAEMTGEPVEHWRRVLADGVDLYGGAEGGRASLTEAEFHAAIEAHRADGFRSLKAKCGAMLRDFDPVAEREARDRESQRRQTQAN